MGSSYNNFLANIEVDEKDIKREMAKREIAKKRQQQYNDELSKVRPKTKPIDQKLNRNIKNTNIKNTKLKKDEQPVSLKQGKDRVKQTNNRTSYKDTENINTNINTKTTNQTQNKRNINNAPTNSPQWEEVDLRIDGKLLRHNSPQNKKLKTRNTNASSEKKSMNDSKHLRQKKIRNAKNKDTAKDSDKIHLTMSKTEYNQKVLGTIRENSTKFIMFRDSTKLAKVPKDVAFLGLYAFILSAVMLYYFSQVAVVKMELSKVNGEYGKLNEVNAQLNIKLATAYNIDNIRQRAENELYMNKPEPHQIMYITVVPENFVEYEMDTEESKKNE